MPRRNTQPVSVAGIEFAALLNETQTYTADIPEYPIETGYTVSDSIILKPAELPLTLLITDTPLTWRGRVRSVSEGHAEGALLQKVHLHGHHPQRDLQQHGHHLHANQAEHRTRL